jgi:hypothetical protein
MNKKTWLTFGVILCVLIFAIILINYKPNYETSEELAKCIGENSILYVQLGCHACETQEEMFAENYGLLNTVDCFYEREKCTDIQVTPTWEIDRELYEGVQSVDKLKELTGC